MEQSSNVCHKNRETLWKRKDEITDTGVDETLTRLRNASHDAYVVVQTKESCGLEKLIRRVWVLLVKGYDWQASFEIGEEVGAQYEEVELMLD